MLLQTKWNFISRSDYRRKCRPSEGSLSLIYLRPKRARWVCSAWSTSWESLSPTSPQSVIDPLRALLKDKAAWLWGPAQDAAFSKLKTMLTSNKTLKLYDPSLCTKVTADSSSYGLAAVLSQKSEDGTWHPVAYASRSLSSTEKRYAQVKKESLA